jgi:hypothetical protein
MTQVDQEPEDHNELVVDSEQEPSELALSRGRLHHRSKDLHGARLGDLLGEVIVDTTNLGHLWRFQCLGCGVKVYMYATRARQLFAIRGDKLACRDCMAQEKSTRTHEILTSFFREMWEQYGNLYGNGWEERAQADVLEELVAKIAPMRYETDPGSTFGLDVETSKPRSRQMAAYLYPLDIGKDTVIRCADCGKDHSRSFGCVLCLEPVCVTCAGAEKHCCQQGLDVEEETLGAIGNHFGLSRERIRQFEKHAFDKLRKGPSLLNDDFDLRRSENRALKYRLANPTKCWCGQRLAGGAYCSRRHQVLAELVIPPTPTSATKDISKAVPALPPVTKEEELAFRDLLEANYLAALAGATEDAEAKKLECDNIYEIYVANGSRTGFWVHRKKWGSSIVKVISIDGADCGLLPGSAPYFDYPPVRIEAYNRFSGRLMRAGEIDGPSVRQFRRIEAPEWASEGPKDTSPR